MAAGSRPPCALERLPLRLRRAARQPSFLRSSASAGTGPTKHCIDAPLDRSRNDFEHLPGLVRLIDRRTQAELALADIPGPLDDERAPLEAPVPVGAERLLARVGTLQLLGEHDGVLDRHAGALPEMRRRRVHGVADQHDPALVPVAGEELPFERLVYDLVVVLNLPRELGDSRRRMLELASHRRSEPLP